MYEALTKKRCVTATNSFAAIIQIVQEKPIPPREINSQIPEELEAICLKAMEKNREDRYQTAAEMVKQLEGFLLQQKRAQEDPTPSPQFQESKTQIVDLSKKKTQIVDLSKTKRNKMTSRNKMTTRVRKSKKYARKHHRRNNNEYAAIWTVIICVLVIMIIVSQLM